MTIVPRWKSKNAAAYAFWFTLLALFFPALFLGFHAFTIKGALWMFLPIELVVLLSVRAKWRDDSTTIQNFEYTIAPEGITTTQAVFVSARPGNMATWLIAPPGLRLLLSLWYAGRISHSAKSTVPYEKIASCTIRRNVWDGLFGTAKVVIGLKGIEYSSFFGRTVPMLITTFGADAFAGNSNPDGAVNSMMKSFQNIVVIPGISPETAQSILKNIKDNLAARGETLQPENLPKIFSVSGLLSVFLAFVLWVIFLGMVIKVIY